MRSRTIRLAGFTLVELLVVIVIIAVLAGAVILAVEPTVGKVMPVRIKHDFKQIGDAIKIFKLDTNHYPENLDELIKDNDIKGWRGPYLEREPLDPWKNLYIYEFTGERPRMYILKTYGADGVEGGDADGKRPENKDYNSEDIYKE